VRRNGREEDFQVVVLYDWLMRTLGRPGRGTYEGEVRERGGNGRRCRTTYVQHVHAKNQVKKKGSLGTVRVPASVCAAVPRAGHRPRDSRSRGTDGWAQGTYSYSERAKSRTNGRACEQGEKQRRDSRPMGWRVTSYEGVGPWISTRRDWTLGLAAPGPWLAERRSDSRVTGSS